MPAPRSARIQDHFATLTDPRRRKVVYPLINIVTIALRAVVAGADDFVPIAEYGREKRAWLSRFLDLTAGTPPTTGSTPSSARCGRPSSSGAR